MFYILNIILFKNVMFIKVFEKRQINYTIVNIYCNIEYAPYRGASPGTSRSLRCFLHSERNVERENTIKQVKKQ